MKANGSAWQKVTGVISLYNTPTRNRVVGQGCSLMRTEEFLAFAKPNLSEAFPNPQRIDCPGAWRSWPASGACDCRGRCSAGEALVGE